MAKTCPKCGAENTDTARFCSNCATSLRGVAKLVPAPTKTLEVPAEDLAPGTLIEGEYQIIEKLGRGGMGEVYRALDVKLDRQVAVKALPEEFSSDPERLARFEREARILASLNHPNIAAVHELAEEKGRRFLILEMVEGGTLHERLERGPLGLEEALETCRQIAAGLEAAHEKGIVHRDLKPGNIMVTPEGQVKILDFGLAKAQPGDAMGADLAESPTITDLQTEPGIIMGTAAYMSPEQARGRPVDKRTDIWAFGCVLFECLTGKKAFPGETASDIIAQILKGEPDWSALPAATPRNITALLRRCLQKDRKDRLHDVADARLEIQEAGAHPPEAGAVSRRPSLPWTVAAAAVLLIAGILVDSLLIKRPRSAPPAPVVISTIKVEPGLRLQGRRAYEEMERPTCAALAVSNDGRFVVYSAIEEDPGPQAKPRLCLRRLDRSEAEPIAGTEGGENPFLSPDSRWLGFSADGKMKKVPIEGGVPITLCDLSAFFLGATWGRDNTIVFADGWAAGLSRIPAEGGKPETLTKPDPKRGEHGHRLPSWLPDGKGVLFTLTRNDWDWQPRLALLRPDEGDWRVLLEDGADARYMPTGHLVFLRRGTLMAVRFDPAKQEVVGQPVDLVEGVMQAFTSVRYFGSTGAGQFGISETGTFVYAPGGVVPSPKVSLMWVDQRGKEQPAADSQFSYGVPRLSPDGRRIAYTRDFSVWLYDLVRGTLGRLTTEGRAYNVIWSPDGKRLLFCWSKLPPMNLYWLPSDGSSPMDRVIQSEYDQQPVSWSQDGKTVAIIENRPDTGSDIAMLDVGSGRLNPFLNSPFDEQYPEFSPAGRWLAYGSDESGREEVYITQYPGPGPKYLVSSEGGREPLWARNGKQLYYRKRLDQPSGRAGPQAQGGEPWWGQMWAVDVLTDGGISPGKPRLLFEKPGYRFTFPISGYDLSPDGQRFLMVKQEQRKPTPVTEMVLVQNWFEEVKRLVPAKWERAALPNGSAASGVMRRSPSGRD